MTVTSYADFLARKLPRDPATGFDVDPAGLNEHLYPFQREIVAWALKRGRAAIFADCGLGKTPMQLEWAHVVRERTGRNVLIVAPLAVSGQTAREAEKFGIYVTVCRGPDDIRPGVNITNYERVDRFHPAHFAGLVLDESSILKDYSGKVRQMLQAFAEQVPYRLACTATPAPNDLLEITNHSDFVGALTGRQVIALFFMGEQDKVAGGKQVYRLKRHAVRDFYAWMASWSVALRKPSDCGHSDDGFELPPLNVHHGVIDAEAVDEGRLFGVEARTLHERLAARRESLGDRVARTVEIVETEPGEQWILWCNLNAEADALRRAIPDAVEVRGSDTPERKEDVLRGFSDGAVRVLVTKPSIAGHGMNWQQCARMAFVGLSDSWEQWYQATRRCWRFGQTRPVDVHVVTSTLEQAVVDNVNRKERQAVRMMDAMVDAMGRLRFGREEEPTPYKRDTTAGTGWTLHLGDSISVIDELDTETAGMAVFSPPFPGMYLYTNSPYDVANSTSIDGLVEHLRYLCSQEKLMRVLMPGRLCAIHLMQLPAYETRDGYAGIRDFRGPVIAMMGEEGWHYAGEVTIDKNPQVQATRHKEHGLLFKTLSTDASRLRMALADYLLYFRKPGENPEPVTAGISPKYNPDGGWVTQDEWIEWAAPVWYRHQEGMSGGIRETDVLNVAVARGDDDERHLCPLQLGVIERAVKLWTNPGDLILSPFAGIGSEGVGALRLGRRFVGVELKESYYLTAIENLRAVADQLTIKDAAA